MNRYLFILLLLPSAAIAQEFQKEINEQVWKSFISTFANRDTDGFMAVHSKDLVRVPRDSKSVVNFEGYRKSNEAGDKHARENNVTRRIELRFFERIASGTQAYEVGIYKVTVSSPNQPARHYYGKFHVVHRKENGVWKILVDSDSSEGGTIDESTFLQAHPME
jgi:ketosteroid isomerase-like protein